MAARTFKRREPPFYASDSVKDASDSVKDAGVKVKDALEKVRNDQTSF